MIRAHLDTRAALKLISWCIALYLNLVPKQTQTTITGAEKFNSRFIGRLRGVPITFGHLTIHIYFLEIKELPLMFIIGYNYLDSMGAMTDLSGQLLDVTHDYETLCFVLEPDQDRNFILKENLRCSQQNNLQKKLGTLMTFISIRPITLSFPYSVSFLIIHPVLPLPRNT